LDHAEKENVVPDKKQSAQAEDQAPAHYFIGGGPAKMVFDEPPPNLNQIECVIFYHYVFKNSLFLKDWRWLHCLYKLLEPIEHK